KVYNNTFYDNNINHGSDCCNGEITIVSNPNTIPNGTPTSCPITVTNNLAQGVASGANGYDMGGVLLTSASVTGNFLVKGMQLFSGNTIGSNATTSPAFTNTSDLLSNRNGAPNCTGFITTTACMGWNANTQTLTNPSTIYDLMPQAAGASSKGYQKPSTTC